MSKIESSSRQGFLSTLGGEDRRTQERRIVLRGNVAQAAGWATNARLELISESISLGRIRLHLAATLDEKLSAKRSEIESDPGADKDEIIAAFERRYSRVVWYPASNGQLVLPSLAAIHLGIAKSASSDVYLEVARPTIDMMSAEYLLKRQRDFGDFISIE